MTSRRDLLELFGGLAGAVGLAGCTARLGGGVDAPSHDLEPNPRAEELPRRQHAWNERLSSNADDNLLLPRHYRIL
ncbi:MAG: hypothetical protein ACOCR0_03190, partial [Haloferacaceae archaeon]